MAPASTETSGAPALAAARSSGQDHERQFLLHPADVHAPSAFDAALRYLRAGLSVVPIASGGAKKPPRGYLWKHLQAERMSEAQARKDWGIHRDCGVAVICGAVSGSVEVLDFDEKDLIKPWSELVKMYAPGVLERVALTRTPRPGWQVAYRCSRIGGNTKLAQTLDGQDEHGKPGVKTLIETRGEGGYVLVPGCPPGCHENGRTYELVRGSLEEIPEITTDERDVLFACARSFNKLADSVEGETPLEDDASGVVRPGDDFNVRATWEAVLVPHGWVMVRKRQDGAIEWRRPGKKGPGISATTDYCTGKDGNTLLYVFTSNAYPLREERCYSKFSAYTLLNHDGDYSAAAAALRSQGYGSEKNGAEEEGEGGDAKATIADRIISLVRCRADLWHDAVPDGYATIGMGEHAETYQAGSLAFRRWILGLVYRALKKAPADDAMRRAIATLDAIAVYEGRERQVAVRVAEHDGTIWLDLGTPDWRIARVTSEGWEVSRATVNDAVRFWRPRGLTALPEPTCGGRLDELRKLWPQLSDDDWARISGWWVGVLHPGRPAPILIVTGEQGSGKSTLGRMLRRTIDPNVSDLRSPPRDERDLVIAARNAAIVAFDNVSYLSPTLSDALCRVATGGGYGTRELYTNAEEMLFSDVRPVLLNGIAAVATRPDLLDRSLLVHVPVLEDEKRLDEETLWARYEDMRPCLLGALLDAAVTALRRLPEVRLRPAPRMADWARWAVAAETVLGVAKGEMLAAYLGSRIQAVRDAIEAAPIGPPLIALLEAHKGWQGTMTALREELTRRVGEGASKSKEWPKTPRGIRGALDRLAPALRASGWTATHIRKAGSGDREVAIRPSQPSRPSHADESGPSVGGYEDMPSDGGRDGPCAEQGRPSHDRHTNHDQEPSLWQEDSWIPDGRDGCDGPSRTSLSRDSNCWKCQAPVATEADETCTSCGWIVCSNCDACDRHCRFREVPQ